MTQSDGGTVRALFVNDEEGRLRAGWRIVLALVATVLATFLGGIGLGAVFAVGPAAGIAGALVVVIGWWLFYGVPSATLVGLGWLLDRRLVRDLGLGGSGWWRNLAFGLVLGLVMTTAVVLLELGAGLVTVEGTLVTRPDVILGGEQLGEFGRGVDPGAPIAVALLATLLFYVGVGVFEELLVRGYLMTNLAEGLRGVGPGGARGAVVVAAVLTSALFGALHAGNPGASALSAINITAVGLFFAWAYVVTDDLGIPIGVHVTWNFSLGAVYGLPVSGTRNPATVFDVRQVGDPLLTGGRFGPEAGLVVYVALAVGVALTWLWVRRTEGAVEFPSDVAVPELRGETASNREG